MKTAEKALWSFRRIMIGVTVTAILHLVAAALIQAKQDLFREWITVTLVSSPRLAELFRDPVFQAVQWIMLWTPGISMASSALILEIYCYRFEKENR